VIGLGENINELQRYKQHAWIDYSQTLMKKNPEMQTWKAVKQKWHAVPFDSISPPSMLARMNVSVTDQDSGQ
jgi:hypothetical protein